MQDTFILWIFQHPLNSESMESQNGVLLIIYA
jgi:hypothetical protein